MERLLYYEIPEWYYGHKISEFLHNMGYSNGNLAQIKRMEESVLIYPAGGQEGRWEYMTYRFCPGDRLAIHIQEEAVSEKIPPVELPFPIVYEDEDIVVVNKPANMPIHPSMNNYENTLGNAAAWYYSRQGKPFVYRCVNRLDRDTTGLTILAKHLVSGSVLYRQMAQREIHREYVAIVEGCVEQEGVIDLPLGRVTDSPIARQVDFAHGDRAVTHFQRMKHIPVLQLKKQLCTDRDCLADCIQDTSKADDMERLADGISAVSLWLETGRTHQIRVHMAYIGHPLVGDFLYNPGSHLMGRQALHARRLSFKHPITGQPMEFTADMPEDMKRLL